MRAPGDPFFKAGKPAEWRVSNPGLRMALKLLGKKAPNFCPENQNRAVAP
jgi:hypothetical protein